MNKDNEFKSITIPFKKSNEDVKKKIIDICDKTGKSKIDIVCDAIRQYDPSQIKNNKTNINREEIEKVVKEILGGMLINNMSININPYMQPAQSITKEKTEEEIEKERLDKLNNKTIDLSLLDDD